MLDFETASTIVAAIGHSRLDYCNSLFLNLESTQLNYLQLIQNEVAKGYHWPGLSPERQGTIT